jgi:cellulose synthase/poly-beta-1,6-N-acetylglucosamine synthase-like glycosyltransferase
MIFFYCCLAICIITIGLNILLLVGYSKIQFLSAQPIIENEPSVAIIIPVRDEEEDLEQALQSVCNFVVTVKQGGIYWRDSFYSLEMLRNQK